MKDVIKYFIDNGRLVHVQTSHSEYRDVQFVELYDDAVWIKYTLSGGKSKQVLINVNYIITIEPVIAPTIGSSDVGGAA